MPAEYKDVPTARPTENPEIGYIFDEMRYLVEPTETNSQGRKGLLAACALTASFLVRAAATPVMSPPPVSEAQLAEVLVVGKQPGRILLTGIPWCGARQI